MHVIVSLVLALSLIGCGSGTGHGGTADLSLSGSDLASGAHPSGTVSPPASSRPSAEPCPLRPASGTCAQSGSGCTTDADCTQGLNGRCQPLGIAGCACNYDQCASDPDCPSGQVCACRLTIRGAPANQGPNACVPSNCETNHDCGSNGHCSPSFSTGACQSYIDGYYCHTAADECGVDSDCKVDSIGYPVCVYRSDLGHWACVAGDFCAG